MAPDAFNVGPFAPRRGIVNGVPNSIIPNPLQRLAHGLNENYAREVMELHTLGVKGGYTQADVVAVARCFTGWTVRNAENPRIRLCALHARYGEKTVLGHQIPAGGGEEDWPEGDRHSRAPIGGRIHTRLASPGILLRIILRRRW